MPKSRKDYAKDWDSWMQYKIIEEDSAWLNEEEARQDIIEKEKNIAQIKNREPRFTEHYVEKVISSINFSKYKLRGEKLMNEIQKTRARLEELSKARIEEIKKTPLGDLKFKEVQALLREKRELEKFIRIKK